MNQDELVKKSIETGKGEIFYFTNSRHPGRPTVVFLHGLSSNHRTWVPAALALDNEKFNSLLIDIRGHGHSDKRKRKSLYNFENLSRDLDLILKKEGLARIILAGYSFGGSISLDFALRHPDMVSGIILVSANHAGPLKFIGPSWASPLADLITNILAWLLIWQSRRKYLYYEPWKGKSYWDTVWKGFKTMPLSVNLWLVSHMINLNLRSLIKEIKAPVWIIHSSYDPFLTKKELKEIKEAIPKVKIFTLDNPSHFIATDMQEEVAEIILRFLKENFVS
ncbi:MAG: alpha/beta hydrolase [Patescibacteria group bacterium]|jgi:pimeloyl-ACP methyl ester carboxylesterase